MSIWSEIAETLSPAALEALEERAAIMEYHGELPRHEAERLAWAAYRAASRCEPRPSSLGMCGGRGSVRGG